MAGNPPNPLGTINRAPTPSASLRSPFMDTSPPVSLLLMSQELRLRRCRSRLYIGLLLAYQSIHYIHYLAGDAYLSQRS